MTTSIPASVKEFHTDQEFDQILIDQKATRGTYSAHITSQTVKAWHILPASQCTTRDFTRVIAGGLLSLNKSESVQLCRTGFHASIHLSDALDYAPDAAHFALTKVESFGEIVFETDWSHSTKLASRYRFCEAILSEEDSIEAMREFTYRAMFMCLSDHYFGNDPEGQRIYNAAINLANKIKRAYESAERWQDHSDQDRNVVTLRAEYTALCELCRKDDLFNAHGPILDALSHALFGASYHSFNLNAPMHIIRASLAIAGCHERLVALLENIVNDYIDRRAEVASDDALINAPAPLDAIKSLIGTIGEFGTNDHRVPYWLGITCNGLGHIYAHASFDDMILREIVRSVNSILSAMRADNTHCAQLEFLLAQLAHYCQMQDQIDNA